MRLAGCVILTGATTLAVAAASEPARQSASDFKLVVTIYGIKKEPIQRAELLSWRGRTFLVVSDSPEVVVLNPGTNRAELVDLERKVHTDLPFERLERYQVSLRKAIHSAIEKREKAGGRGDRIAAQMSRDLVDPQFKETFDAAAGRLRLTNSSAEIDIAGAPDGDQPRLDAIATGLAVMIKLASLRDPEAIPPFTRLDALKAMITDHHLRPTEMTIIYRLAGPPIKYRWTYALETRVSSDELQVLNKIGGLLESSRALRFEHYERRDAR